MRNNSNSQINSATCRRFLMSSAGISNEAVLLLIVMIVLFIVNLYYLIKNNIINTIYRILKRIFVRLMDCNIEFIKNIDMFDPNEKEDKNGIFEKKGKNKFNNYQLCYICLNNIDLEVIASCFHSFCG